MSYAQGLVWTVDREVVLELGWKMQEAELELSRGPDPKASSPIWEIEGSE